MERKSLLAVTPQEVIITICRGEPGMGGWGWGEGWHAAAPISVFWHGDETLHHTSRLHVVHTYAQMQGDEHAHTQAQTFSGPQAAAENFLERAEQSRTLLYDALLFGSVFSDCHRNLTGSLGE